MRTRSLLSICLFSLLLIACASAGRPFATDRVSDLAIGTTTQNDVLRMFGQPWRTGLDSDLVTWTYARYGWSLFRGSSATDLVTRFNTSGLLVSYTFNTTEGEKTVH